MQAVANPTSKPGRTYAPMLARSGPMPASDRDYAYEFKWDGVRCLLRIEGGKVALRSREGADITATYPELADAGNGFRREGAVLDGEIVALDENGRPSFSVLQHRMHVAKPSPRLLAKTPITFFAFDLLELDGERVFQEPYRKRRQLLESLAFRGPHWLTAPSHPGPGAAVLEASRAQGLEGIVAKAVASPYRPGARSDEWIKIKNRLRQEFVVGGWTRGEGARSLTFGALLLGYYEGRGRTKRLVYAGRVGTGFDDHAIVRLEKRLRALRRDDSPFAGEAGPGPVVFVEPRLVAEVEFSEWTPDGMLRHPSFRGLRDDKDPSTIEREDAPPSKVT